MQAITNYRNKSSADISLPGSATPDDLNEFYAPFNRIDSASVTAHATEAAASIPPAFSIDKADIKRMFKKQDTKKAPGPDGAMNSTVKHFATKLSPVLTNFDTSLN